MKPIPLLSVLLLFLFFVAAVSEGRSEWPELVGCSPEDAVKVIRNDKPTFKIQIVKYGQSVTQEFVLTRVRIFLDLEGKVAYPPRIG
ncbi:hypothetical protein HPP92_019239 [Vanilla planifolia]|uniref:Uncharacterized protein n=1 Tax=Vanilla planifolia TaxID=51239 RepID=A0A835Q8I3_VANPL|nr:hypothetical protein HPP92_019239 [Vanilla planifolia]